MELVILLIGVLVFFGHLLSAVFSWTRIPDVLVLMLVGILIGPVLGLVSPADFGKVGSAFTTIALLVILFESGTGLNVQVLRRALREAVVLTLASFVLAVFAVSLVGYFLLGLSVFMAVALGAILGGTSAIIVIPIVQMLRTEEKTKTVLLLESALTDVLCIVVTLAVLEAYAIGGNPNIGQILGRILASFLLAGAMGFLAGVVWSYLLLHLRRFPNTIFTTIAYIFVLYGVTEFLGYSGAIATLAFGVTLGNAQYLPLHLLKDYVRLRPVEFDFIEKTFFGEIVFLVKVFFFVYLGLSMRMGQFYYIQIALLITALLYGARLVVVRLFASRDIPLRDATFMAVMIPKGLAPAVLASIPLQRGLPQGEVIQEVTYAVILFTVVFTSLLIWLIERTALGRIYESLFRRLKVS
nr:MAG: sodium:proton antiporter [Bacteroidota bacterium]